MNTTVARLEQILRLGDAEFRRLLNRSFHRKPKLKKGGWLPPGLMGAEYKRGKPEVVINFLGGDGVEEIAVVIRDAMDEWRKEHPPD